MTLRATTTVALLMTALLMTALLMTALLMAALLMTALLMAALLMAALLMAALLMTALLMAALLMTALTTARPRPCINPRFKALCHCLHRKRLLQHGSTAKVVLTCFQSCSTKYAKVDFSLAGR